MALTPGGGGGGGGGYYGGGGGGGGALTAYAQAGGAGGAGSSLGQNATMSGAMSGSAVFSWAVPVPVVAPPPPSPTPTPAIQVASTTTLSTLSGLTMVTGQPVTLIATVQAQSSGEPVPTGNVVFLNVLGQSMGVASLHTKGPGLAQATLIPALGGAGTYGGITAFYGGDTYTTSSSSMAAPITLVVQPGSFLNDTASGLIYSGNWGYSTNRGVGDYQDDEHYTTTNGDSFGDYFTGTGVRVLGETNSGGGTDTVYVDGVKKATINTFSQTRLAQQVLYSIGGLAAGRHEIKVVKTSGSYLEVDALAIVQ